MLALGPFDEVVLEVGGGGASLGVWLARCLLAKRTSSECPDVARDESGSGRDMQCSEVK